MSEPDEYYELSLFKKTGYSKVWNPADMPRQNQDEESKSAQSEETPDLDFDDIATIVQQAAPEYHTESHYDPDEIQSNRAKQEDWLDYDYKKKFDDNDSFDVIPKASKIEGLVNEAPKIESEHTPSCKSLISGILKPSNPRGTQENSKEILIESLDDKAKVIKCLNRKDVVVKR